MTIVVSNPRARLASANSARGADAAVATAQVVMIAYPGFAAPRAAKGTDAAGYAFAASRKLTVTTTDTVLGSTFKILKLLSPQNVWQLSKSGKNLLIPLITLSVLIALTVLVIGLIGFAYKFTVCTLMVWSKLLHLLRLK